MHLSEIIIQKIDEKGPLSFHDFMEMCLYYPELGYYTSVKDRIGKNGDYYTCTNIGELFGAMIGRQLEEMWKATGKKDFTIVEYGAGTGLLCRDILKYLENNTRFYDRASYCIIEKSPAMQEKEKEHLPARVNWIDSIEAIPGITGCILSNELVDNFAVHQVVMKDELMEVFVDYRNGFIELLQPAAKELINYLDELNVVLPKGFRTEINLEAVQWMKEISRRLKKGYVLTIDYGYPSPELYCNGRSNGTLLCYYNHLVHNQPYINIGEQDITSHVNFSALTHWGSKYGLQTCGLTCQANFLVALGYEDYLQQVLLQSQDRYLNMRQYAFLKYTLLLDMGQKFKVLVQSKGVPATTLCGIQ